MSETMTQKDMEDFLATSAFGGGPKSVGEALAVETPPEPEVEVVDDTAPIVVQDEPVQDTPVVTTDPALAPEPVVDSDPGDEDGDTLEDGTEDDNVIWAKKKYGPDSAKWAKAAYEQEQQLGRIANEKREAEELASQWYEYAQQVEANASQMQTASFPMSSQEEAWIENSLSNPLEAARQAAYNGNATLYNGVITRVAEENPMLATQIGTTIQMELLQAAQQQEAQQQTTQQAPDLGSALGSSFARLGIDLGTYGPRMSERIGELGEYHPYTQAILAGDDAQRDLAIQAIYDIVRATSLTTRRKESAVEKENELRRDVASVQTGGIAPPAVPRPTSSFVEEMQEEWKRSGALKGD